MEAATLTALNQSIEKWERNAVAETPDDYAVRVKDCPLCDIFFRGGCRGCPVMAATGESGCGGSPYRAAVRACYRWEDADTALRDAAHAAARAEVAFLRSLLPEGEDR